MARPIVLSNGSMHIGINLFGMVHDVYYPYVGLENHAAANGRRNRIGVWVENQFSWLDDGAWQFAMSYEPGALISHTTAHHPGLGITLELNDCVDSEYDAFLRNIHIINAADRNREVRLFMQTSLLISNNLNGDTVQYLPGEPAILHYKGHRAFVVGGRTSSGESFDQFSVGIFGIEGKAGTYRDAEDGHLQGNTVEHGKVDSVIGFTEQIPAFNSTRVSYWLAAGTTQQDALKVHRALAAGDIQQRFLRTADFWHRWLQPAESFITTLPKNLQSTVRKNLLLIKSHIDRRGAVIASTDTTKLNYERDAYAYCWPRDASYGLWPLLRLGYKTELLHYFSFCRNALHPEGFLMHKYQADGALGSSWQPYIIDGRIVPPIQEDETAIVVFLFSEYIKTTKDKRALEEFYPTLIKPAADFMASYIDPLTKLPHASYDLWEQTFLTTTYTTALVYAALNAAAKLAEQRNHADDAVAWQTVADDIYAAAGEHLYNKDRGYFNKGFVHRNNGDWYVDGSIDVSAFYGAFMFGLFDSASNELQTAYATLKKTFSVPDQGVAPLTRFEHDMYNIVDPSTLGNPWPICTFWLAQFEQHMGRPNRAHATIEWAQNLMIGTGVLPEQINPYNNAFVSIAPLVWSQAEFINTIIDTYRKEDYHAGA